MVDEQTQAFTGEERLVAMTLGLAAVTDRVASLLALRRASDSAAMAATNEPEPGGAPAAELEPEPLMLALLGVLSLRRSLWASLSAQPSLAEAALVAVSPVAQTLGEAPDPPVPAPAEAASAGRGFLR